MNECPCQDCICIPVCRHKRYDIVLRQCSIIMDLLYKGNIMSEEFRKPEFSKNIREIEKYLKPITWIPSFDGRGYTKIEGVIL